MQQLIIVDVEILNKMQQSIDELKQLILSQQKTTVKQTKTKSDVTEDELNNWVIMKVGWKKLGISKGQWYRTYQYIIKHKNRGGKNWIYLPSILEFLQQDNIN